MDVSSGFVVLMGIGTVFFGLICIIVLSMAMSAICRSMGGAAPSRAPAAPRSRSKPIDSERQAMIAPYLPPLRGYGDLISGIRILSVKKL